MEVFKITESSAKIVNHVSQNFASWLSNRQKFFQRTLFRRKMKLFAKFQPDREKYQILKR